MNDNDTENYRALRVTLESMTPPPGIITVGAAHELDRSGTVACGLARVFADAGHRTLIIDPYGGRTLRDQLGLTVTQLADVARLSRGAANGVIKNLSAIALSETQDCRRASTTLIRSATAQLRGVYDVVIVDARQICNNSVALSFASVSDGVLLAFRFGRRPISGDRETVAQLEAVKAKILGVVATGGSQTGPPMPPTRIEAPAAPPQAQHATVA